VVSKSYDTMSIDGRALRSEGNGPVTSSTPQTEFVQRTPGKNASGKPSTKDDIQTVHLCAFTPPGLPLDQEATERFERLEPLERFELQSFNPQR
jgi:hypothetical protein